LRITFFVECKKTMVTFFGPRKANRMQGKGDCELSLLLRLIKHHVDGEKLDEGMEK